jgi:hypothetical protein
MLFLKSGWEDFVKAHGLQENDILIFTCSGNSAFDVLIFEASGCEKVSSLFANRNAHNMFKHFDNIVDQGKQAEHYLRVILKILLRRNRLGPLTMTILQRDLVAGIQVSRFATSLYLK